jgi:NADH-quinone oxidoreductase subunit J
MNVPFLIAATVAVVATALAVTRANVVHALLYFVVSLFAVAVVFLLLGAPFVAALEVIVYAGAIIVLFLFAVMLLDLRPTGVAQERVWLRPRVWVWPAVLAFVLGAELVWIAVVGASAGPDAARRVVGPKEVGLALYGPYLLGVEIASFLLLAGLVGAWRVARRDPPARGGATPLPAEPPVPGRHPSRGGGP